MNRIKTFVLARVARLRRAVAGAIRRLAQRIDAPEAAGG